MLHDTCIFCGRTSGAGGRLGLELNLERGGEWVGCCAYISVVDVKGVCRSPMCLFNPYGLI